MTTATQAPATGAKGHIDPAAAFVPVQTRSERATSFDPDDFGMPTGREVNWKHTPVDRLRSVLVDEPVAVDPDERLRMHALTHGWRILSLREASPATC